MSERKEGLYWVKLEAEHEWSTAKWVSEQGVLFYWLVGNETWEDEHMHAIGQRIPSPDEPWQTVPIEPDRNMCKAGHEAIAKGLFAYAVFKDMMAAAPKPGDES